MFQPAGNGKLYVGSKRTGGFVLVKKYWEPIIVLLREPITVHDLARKLTRIDPKNFPADKSLSLTKLMLMKFVEHSLIENIGQAKILKTKRSKTILACPRWTGLLTRPYLVKFYVFLAFLALVLPLFYPSVFPRAQDFFWHERFSISFLSFFLVSWVIGVQHELIHFLTACSKGVWSRIGLSYRLNFLVLETDYVNIHAISRLWRIAVFLSGMVSDLIVILVLSLAVILTENSFLKQIILLEWLGFGWQFLFFMRTDLYYAIKEVVQVENLYTYAKEKIISLLTGRRFSHSLNKRENFFVNLYTIFFFLGTLFAAVRYGFYVLPIVFKLVLGSIGNLYLGYTEGNLVAFWDGLIVIVVQVFVFALFVLKLATTKWQALLTSGLKNKG